MGVVCLANHGNKMLQLWISGCTSQSNLTRNIAPHFCQDRMKQKVCKITAWSTPCRLWGEKVKSLSMHPLRCLQIKWSQSRKFPEIYERRQCEVCLLTRSCESGYHECCLWCTAIFRVLHREISTVAPCTSQGYWERNRALALLMNVGLFLSTSTDGVQLQKFCHHQNLKMWIFWSDVWD